MNEEASRAASHDVRREEIRGNLTVVEERIRAACRASGRARAEVTLVAVTKTFPATDVRHLVALGLRDMAESRAQEATAKVDQCARMDLSELRWHLVGQLQTNKARAVGSFAHTVHSVDRHELVSLLDRAAASRGWALRCLVQVNLDEPHRAAATAAPTPPRGGAVPAAVPELAAAIDRSAHLVLGGLMAVAPLGAAPADAFARLATFAADLRTSYPCAGIVSAGMSGDLEAAVRYGATHLRIGSAILGSRPPLR